jgi:hypothetical protein
MADEDVTNTTSFTTEHDSGWSALLGHHQSLGTHRWPAGVSIGFGELILVKPPLTFSCTSSRFGERESCLGRGDCLAQLRS